MNEEFLDSSPNDIHLAVNDPLTGTFAPDVRNVDPFGAVDTDPRTAFLCSFNGLDPNGPWTLFLADVSPLAVSTVQSWTVNVTTAVPEPGCLSLIGLGSAVGLLTS